MAEESKARLVLWWPASLWCEGGRYVRAASASVNWPKRLEILRSADFSSENSKAEAVRLLSGCGFAPVVENAEGRKAARWTEEHINDKLLARLRSVQQAVRALYDERENAIQKAWNYRVALAKPRARGTPPSTIDINQIAKGLAEHLKKLRVDVPQRDPNETVGGKYLGELFGALRLAIATGKEKKSFEQVMQRITKSAPLRDAELPEPPYPDAVLRHLLDFGARDQIVTDLTFIKDCLPVVSLTPLDPIAALLLRAHASTVLRPVTWAACEWCGKHFDQKRADRKTCSEQHKNNLKKANQRATKRERTHNA
jgi:hypothetical protein